MATRHSEGGAKAAPFGDDASTYARARFAHLTTDGTGFIVGGSLVAGLAAYAYQFLGGRVLGAHAFAPVSVLLTIHFLTFIVILMPVEQLVVRRLTIDRARSGLPSQAWWLMAVTTAAATVFAFVGVDHYLNGDGRFIVFTGFTVVVHALFAAARGHLAGWRRFKEYGVTSAAASLVRLAVALAVSIVRPSASGLALGLIAGPLIVMAWRPFRRVEVARAPLDPEAAGRLEDRGLLAGLVLAAAASQVLLLAGPLVVGALGGSTVEISVAYAVFTLGRAPLAFGYNLLARVLPPFTVMAATGDRRELRAWARGMAWAALALSGVAAALGWLIGPWSVRLAFGEGFSATPGVAAGVAFGVIFAGAGLFVGQILVARGRSLRLGVAWLVGIAAAGATVVALPRSGPVARVTVGFVVGEVLALLVLVAGAIAVDRDDDDAAAPSAAYLLAKRTLDIAVAIVVLVLTAPVLAAAAVAVRLDSPGPVFFRQTRVGRKGAPFGLLKIRTMRADGGEEVFAEHLARLDAARHGENDQTIRISDDPRITRVGGLLRRWSLDELPNLWNVVNGSMSLVGPRPLVAEEASLIGLDNPRFGVKPGITGLAQVQGRDTISLSARTALDEAYVANRSLRGDIGILVRTAVAVVRQPGD
jgi:lipopolysaccharide/colanic/teichoic acid biosynthesis glycosyltransferase